MDGKVRVGAVSYLNTRPLVFGFEQGVAADRIALSYEVPSSLTDRMAEGALDVALLPAIEIARLGNLSIVPGLSLSTIGPVRSVLLVTKRPLPEIRSVALDPESRTSNALTRVLFAKVWKGDPEFVAGPREIDEALSSHDAVVRIGDKALFDPVPSGCTAVDLGAAWTEATSLPFVYAAWAARPGVVDRNLYRDFHLSRRLGGNQIEMIGLDYTWRGRQWPSISIPYLRDTMRYRLGGPEVRGLVKFWDLAAEIGLLERKARPVIGFYSETKIVCTPR